MIEMITDCAWAQPNRPKTHEEVYAEKREFVDKLAEALKMLPDIEDVEYFDFEDLHEEIVKITYSEDRDYICVGADSLHAIIWDILKGIDRRPNSALITNEQHADLIDTWIREGRHISK